MTLPDDSQQLTACLRIDELVVRLAVGLYGACLDSCDALLARSSPTSVGDHIDSHLGRDDMILITTTAEILTRITRHQWTEESTLRSIVAIHPFAPLGCSNATL